MKWLTLLIAMLMATTVYAVQPDEMLSDPALEARAREVSKDLRCLVCRNESIDDSNADLAKDLRILVRERIMAGDTNDEVKQYLVDRYGEYVLLNPMTNGANVLLWWAGPIAGLFGIMIAVAYLRTRAKPEAAGSLSDDEKARLEQILRD